MLSVMVVAEHEHRGGPVQRVWQADADSRQLEQTFAGVLADHAIVPTC